MTARTPDDPGTARPGANRSLLSSGWVRLGLVAAAIAIVVVGFGTWYVFFRPSGPPPVDLANVPLPSAVAPVGSSAAPGASSPASGGAVATPPAATTAAGGSAAPTAAGGLASLDGTWKVDPSIGSGDSGSFVGYRVQEQLASIGGNTAVGRTSAVTGTFTLSGTTVTDASFSADLSSLASDDQRRDGMIQRIGLQSNQFPTATFVLGSPIDLGTLPADGTVAKVTANGKLTIHGQTRDVSIPLQARRAGAVIAVAGSLPVAFADYGMEKPTTGLVLSVADPAVIEFQLMFSKS